MSFIEKLSSLRRLKGTSKCVCFIERLSSLRRLKGTSKCVLYREIVLSSEVKMYILV